MSKQSVLFPPGRMVQGSLYEAQDKDADGNPLTVKSGPNAGQQRVQYYIAVAIPKGPEAQWYETEWGKAMVAVGFAAFPQAANSPTFAWKVTDGDSQIPNSKGRKPCESEGFPGNWVVRFSSGYAPKICNADGTQQITEVGAVKCGYYVQVYATVDGNGSTQRPGLFVNLQAVAMVGYGPEIVVGPDLAAVGFGKGPLPAGASATPPAGAFNPGQMPATPSAPGAPAGPSVAPAMSAAPAAPMAPAAAMPAAPAAPTVAVTPNPGILNPPMPPAAPAAPVRQMTPKAGGHTYESLIQAGWNDVTLRQEGLML